MFCALLVLIIYQIYIFRFKTSYLPNFNEAVSFISECRSQLFVNFLIGFIKCNELDDKLIKKFRWIGIIFFVLAFTHFYLTIICFIYSFIQVTIIFALRDRCLDRLDIYQKVLDEVKSGRSKVYVNGKWVGNLECLENLKIGDKVEFSFNQGRSRFGAIVK